MCDINPEYKQHVRYEKGQKVLYLRILRAIYGCIESALRWYILYEETLEKEGYKLNDYDRCVANKIVNCTQCTIAWYVDDNKASHVDPSLIDDLLEVMKSHFGNFTITRGKEQTFPYRV